MTREEFFQRLSQLRTHRYRGKRAPNKPLLLLLALGGVAQGHGRLVFYRVVERHLGALLRRFGPPRKHVHPEFPFGRLRADGLWEILGVPGRPILVSSQVGGRRPSTGLLIDVVGTLLRPPRSSILSPDPEYVAWHREEVFRDPPIAS